MTRDGFWTGRAWQAGGANSKTLGEFPQHNRHGRQLDLEIGR
jgi:hypothetical protein